jgi:hypothetical protein
VEKKDAYGQKRDSHQRTYRACGLSEPDLLRQNPRQEDRRPRSDSVSATRHARPRYWLSRGYAPLGVLTVQPKKKPKGKTLGVADLFFNRLISSVRIRVEHVIASVKRCRIVKDVLRNTKEGFSDLVMRVACALHNWRISFRHPTPSQQLLFGYSR